MLHYRSGRLVLRALLAISLVCPGIQLRAQQRSGHDTFLPAEVTLTMGVGGVTSSSARFRVRSSTTDSVNVELSRDTLFSNSIFGSSVLAEGERNNTVLIDVGGLQASQRYYYRAWIDGVPQPRIQSFRTFPVAGTPATFSFGFGSCQQSGSLLPSTSPGKVFREVARSGASLFLQLGDWGYPDSVDDLPVNNNFFSADYGLVQQSYVTRFQRDYPMDAVLSTMPIDYVYDDHDYMNNNASSTSCPFYYMTGSGIVLMEVPGPGSARENSIRGYIENMPAYPLANESRGIYHKFTVGNAEIFMLDLRSQRSPNLEILSKNTTTGKWEHRVPPGHSLLASPSAPGTGTDQLTWLLEGLKTSTARWKFLVSSVAFNRAQGVAISIGIALQDSVSQGVPGVPSGVPGIAAAVEFADKWAGFPADLDTLLKAIREQNITNVMVLSGDSHTAGMDDGRNAGLPEIMAGGLDIRNSRMAAGFAAFGMNIWNRGGQGLTTQLFNNAFGKVTVHQADSVVLELIDEEGTVFASQTIRDAQTDVSEEPRPPEDFALFQNYPNPFNPRTVVSSQLPVASEVEIGVYDLLGREVAVPVKERRAAGRYHDSFDASGLASGAYVYRMTAGPFRRSRTMLLIK